MMTRPPRHPPPALGVAHYRPAPAARIRSAKQLCHRLQIASTISRDHRRRSVKTASIHAPRILAPARHTAACIAGGTDHSLAARYEGRGLLSFSAIHDAFAATALSSNTNL